ncbi:unnamed protein product, partial [Hapterophycus canaliculatus]
MDVQGVIRWLVGAKIPVSKAMPVVSKLAAAGVRDSEGIASMSQETLAATVQDKSLLKKIRAKISDKGSKRCASGGASSTESGGTANSSTSKRARTSPSGPDKTLAAAAECVPETPISSMSDAEVAAIEIKINRSPVMVLWAAEVAQRLSFDWSESITLGRAVADWLAMRKGEQLGLLEVDEMAERAAREETDALPTRTVEMMGENFMLRKTKGGWRAISKGKLVPAKRVHTFLCKAFGNSFGPARAALRALVSAIPQHQVESTIRTMVLYESFRPEVPKGKAGWGQSGMLRLRTVLELRDELEREREDAGRQNSSGDGG